MKASLFVTATLLLFVVIDGIGVRMCYGRDIPLHFHQMRCERIALQAAQRLKSARFPWNRIYPPPEGNYRKAQTAPISKTWPLAPTPSQQPLSPQPPAPPLPPPAPPPPPPPSFRVSLGEERRGYRGGYPKMEP
ncbi:hypothetical protein DITRI_Ditri06bG0144100 [Diplodiscus trichospermus]